MRKILFVTFILSLLLSCQDTVNHEDYSKIQKRLIPAVVIGDSIVTTYSLEERMAHYHVPGVSIAIFKNDKIVWTNSNGVIEANREVKVNPETSFQVASISKSVTALGVLKLAEKHNLDLDEDINQYLKSWKIESPLLENEDVTIRRLLSHTAGINIGGFSGYEKTDTIPGTVDVLKGLGNTPPVGVDTIPGSKFSYSGGGYVILQQLIEDVSGNSFEEYFIKEVFQPLGMINSTFNQFPETNVVIGHDGEGKPSPFGWRIYPELAAAGLWSTPVDLARFCLAIERAYHGEETEIISRKIAQEMLTPVKNWGLGVGLRGENQDRIFFHGGSNPGGYRNILVDAFNARTGIIVLTNSEQGDKLHDEIIRSFSKFFDIDVLQPRHIKPVILDEKKMERFVGKYHFREMGDYFLEISTDSDNQLILYDPNDGMKNTFLPINDTTFVEKEDGLEIAFKIDSTINKVLSMNYNGTYTFYKIDTTESD